MLLYLALMGLSSLPIWREDRLLFMRERAAGAYGTPAYFTAVSCDQMCGIAAKAQRTKAVCIEHKAREEAVCGDREYTMLLLRPCARQPRLPLLTWKGKDKAGIEEVKLAIALAVSAGRAV
jgi:hypothetical protein